MANLVQNEIQKQKRKWIVESSVHKYYFKKIKLIG